MDPETKLGLLLLGLGTVTGLGWFVFKKLFGPPPAADPTSSGDVLDGDGGHPPGTD